MIFRQKPKELTVEQQEEIRTKDFFDLIMPGTVRFFSDYYTVGDSYRCVWAIREYPPQTEEQAILSRLGDKRGVTIRIYNRLVSAMEREKIIQNADRKNKMKSASNNITEAVRAEGNLNDIVDLLMNADREREILLHTAVYIELTERSRQKLRALQNMVSMELTRAKITVDRLMLKQKEGFLSVLPTGSNMFGAQYERVLPSSSVANLYPFNFSGKTDPHGLYIGRDKYGTNILVDFDKRAEDKTTSNILILGNSGMGKSYLLKTILTNIRESGKKILCLDPEAEYEDLCVDGLGGTYLDCTSGENIINPLEPKIWNDTLEEDTDAPDAFRKRTRLSQHIAFLKDFFRAYKDFTDAQIDTIEILLGKLYDQFGITDKTDFSKLKSTNYPIMEDFYELLDREIMEYKDGKEQLYTEELLKEVRLSLNSMCKGAESIYFNGHTNIKDDNFLAFGVKDLMDSNKRLRETVLFNIFSYMNSKLLTAGNTVASIDEFYLFLDNITVVEYIRNSMKRVRKKESAVILASQNVDEFLIPSIKEYTKPLFSIPTHHFLFNPGEVNAKDFMEAVQIEQSEFDLIKNPEKGTCLYKCGNERYLLQVKSPEYKSKLYGKAGGR
ncbi:MAG: DUF87 domain-containing protein [Clostridia bacterium]|nr:DUF87 domain-containing protein [Clostridia bacterium]